MITFNINVLKNASGRGRDGQTVFDLYLSATNIDQAGGRISSFTDSIDGRRGVDSEGHQQYITADKVQTVMIEKMKCLCAALSNTSINRDDSEIASLFSTSFVQQIISRSRDKEQEMLQTISDLNKKIKDRDIEFVKIAKHVISGEAVSAEYKKEIADKLTTMVYPYDSFIVSSTPITSPVSINSDLSERASIDQDIQTIINNAINTSTTPVEATSIAAEPVRVATTETLAEGQVEIAPGIIMTRRPTLADIIQPQDLREMVPLRPAEPGLHLDFLENLQGPYDEGEEEEEEEEEEHDDEEPERIVITGEHRLVISPGLITEAISNGERLTVARCAHCGKQILVPESRLNAGVTEVYCNECAIQG